MRAVDPVRPQVKGRCVTENGVTHVNIAGIRYVPVAPAVAVRNAVQEYFAMRLSPRDESLTYLAATPSPVLCRGDWERIRRVAGGAASDARLSTESRDTFARLLDVLDRAIPWSARALGRPA
jgi:hypothetical protein